MSQLNKSFSIGAYKTAKNSDDQALPVPETSSSFQSLHSQVILRQNPTKKRERPTTLVNEPRSSISIQEKILRVNKQNKASYLEESFSRRIIRILFTRI